MSKTQFDCFLQIFHTDLVKGLRIRWKGRLFHVSLAVADEVKFSLVQNEIMSIVREYVIETTIVKEIML